MKLAIIGSRSLHVENLEAYIPRKVAEIISGGAKGIDTCAKNYAINHEIKLTEIYPDYVRYHKGAPLKRNLLIIDYADRVLVFWDGTSTGTKFVMDTCRQINKPMTVYLYNKKENRFQLYTDK